MRMSGRIRCSLLIRGGGAKTIGPNAQAGKVWEQNVDTIARGKYGSSNVESQVLVRPLDASGNPVNYRVRLDNTISQPGQQLRLVDAKGSQSAGYTRNQTKGYPLLQQNGGVIESGSVRGTVIPRTRVERIDPVGIGNL